MARNLSRLRPSLGRLACVASVSARVRRESWEESTFFYSFRSNFGAITRLETLTAQATLKMAFLSLRFEQKEHNKEFRLDEPVLNGQLVFRLV